MLKEHAEIRPEDKIEATQGTKDEFLYNIDVLTEQSKNAGGQRMGSFSLPDGKSAFAIYNTEQAMQWVEDSGAADDPTHAQLNIYEPVGKDREKVTVYYLNKSGNIEKHVEIDNQTEELDEYVQGEAELGRGEITNRDLLLKLKEKIENKRAMQEEEKKVGLAFVSEADLKEVNKLLKELAEQQKENALHSSQRPPKS